MLLNYVLIIVYGNICLLLNFPMEARVGFFNLGVKFAGLPKIFLFSLFLRCFKSI